MKTLISSVAIAATLALGATALTATPASARIVCNAAGDCWHVDRRERFAPNLGIRYYPDDWYFHQHWDADRDHHWREHHEGRGYWDHGNWVPR